MNIEKEKSRWQRFLKKLGFKPAGAGKWELAYGACKITVQCRGLDYAEKELLYDVRIEEGGSECFCFLTKKQSRVKALVEVLTMSDYD